MFIKWIRYGIEETKFLKSFNDLKIFCNQKLPFLVTKVTGNPIKDTDVPPSLQLEPTSYCNADCICCPTDRMKRKKGHMDFELFKKIINEASEIDVKRVHLYLHGEPMMHPRVVDIIRHIKSKGLGITMTTNGMLFNKEKIKDILHSGVNSGDYFMFSILGYSKVVHEKIMRGVNHERVVKSILDLIELRKQHKVNGPIVEVIFYRMPENLTEEAQFLKKWRGIADHVHPSGKISISFAKYKTEDKSIPVRNKTCKLLWERMAIYWNGDVTICAEDLDGEHILDNLRKKTIKEVWNCDKLLLIKKLHKENNFEKLSLCSRCDQ